MTDFSDVTVRANAAVNRWLVGRYRNEGDNTHLRECPALTLSEVEGRDSTYGCDTGCEYARLEAVASCEHGARDDFDYGQFGDLSSMLEQILTDEGEIEPPQREVHVVQVTGSPVIPHGVWTRLIGADYEVCQDSGANVPCYWKVTRVVGEYETLTLGVADGPPLEAFTLALGGMRQMIAGTLPFSVPGGWANLHYRTALDSMDGSAPGE